jgi:hypothetical protein
LKMRIACGMSMALLVLGTSAVGFAAEERTFDKTVAAQPHGVVDISNVAGEVQVSGWDRQEVSIHGELGAQVERVDVSSDGGRTSIKVVLPNHTNGHGEAELRIQVPRDSEVDVSAVSADIKITGVQGVERLNSVSGDVTGELGGADAEVKTVSGEIRLKGHGAAARLQVNSVSGDVRLEHGAGDFEGTTVSGTLDPRPHHFGRRASRGEARARCERGSDLGERRCQSARQRRGWLLLRGLELQRRHQ